MNTNLTKKIFLIGFVSIFIFSSSLMPATKAQTWSYNGADTEQIPYFSVYPSEWYIYNFTAQPQKYSIMEITHGNISDYGLGNGYSVWMDRYYQNVTTGELEFSQSKNGGSWNDSIGYQGVGELLPVESDGMVSQRIWDNVTAGFYGGSSPWEYNQTDITHYSIKFWNEISNDWYLIYNYTSKGVRTSLTMWIGPSISHNLTLISSPAQLPPEFSFTTEDGNIYVSSTNVRLRVNITDVDNNNNGVIDTDYLYRILINSTWSNWAAIPALIDYDLSSIPIGAHQVTIEVKNMYGVTQEQITIQHIPPTHGDIGIPGYSTILLTAILLIGVSIILFRHQKKSKYRK